MLSRWLPAPVFAALALASMTSFAAVPEATLSTTPTVGSERVALLIGNNLGFADEVPLRYAEADAERIARALSDLGGFDGADIELSLGENASALRARLARIEARLRRHENPLLFVYYSGHGDETALHLGSSRLPLEELNRFLDRFPGAVRIALVDSCKSGALVQPTLAQAEPGAVRAKGARAGDSFDIEVVREPGVTGKIIITSSSEDEVAQESEYLRGSFFTHYWVSGLYGAADESGDGLVTLDEAYRYAHFMTVHKTSEAEAGVQHPSYHFALSGEGSVVLARLARASANLVIETEGVPGHYFVLDRAKKLVLTELLRGRGNTSTVRLPPGTYRIHKREPDTLRMADVVVVAGETTRLSDASMEALAYTAGPTKGTGVAQRLPSSTTAPLWAEAQDVRVGVGVRSGLTAGMLPTAQLRAGYRLSYPFFFVEPRVVVRGSYVLGFVEAVYGEVGAGVSAGPRLRWGDIEAAAGLDLGLVGLGTYATRVRPGPLGASVRPTGLPLSLEGGAFGELGYHPTDWLSVTGRVHADALLAVEAASGQAGLLPSAGAQLGVAFRF